MKRVVFMAALLLLGGLASAQSFVNTENVWQIKHFNFLGYHYSSAFIFGEEELIDNKVYRRLYECGDSLLLSCSPTSYVYREDSLGRVYSKRLDDEELLIYDFSATIDTITIDDYCWYTLDVVDSLQLLDGSFAKQIQYKVFDDYEVKMVEGIGSLSYPLFPDDNCIFDALDFLSCYFRSGELLLDLSPTQPCFSHITAISEPVESNMAQLAPNPAFANAAIKISIQSPLTFTLRIWSPTGALVLEEAVQKDAEFSLPHSGMYFFTLSDREGRLRQVGKLAVQ
ncbi:MAG TPA: hypothetical protein PKA00_17515 [Saprospiraceae bacterium]|nr:hypothetical protein [Saprospiraceae bacterium]HMQ84720.1 hypothetical protein [Saprospiraceae bacterium]